MFPELANPIAMTFDDSGRLWVAVSPTYPHLIPGDKPGDKLLILEDTDRDGVADEMTVFADGLYIPTGFVLSNDGAYVVSQPNLLHLRDHQRGALFPARGAHADDGWPHVRPAVYMACRIYGCPCTRIERFPVCLGRWQPP